MTSTLSLHKFFRKECRQTLWLPLLIGAISIFVYPFRYLSLLQGTERMARIHDDVRLVMHGQTVAFFGPGDELTLIAALVAGILCAMVSFAFMDARERVDFYHSLAIKRGHLYGITFWRGWIAAAIPYLFFVLISFFAISGLYHCVNSGTLIALVTGIGAHLLAFTAIYAVAVLAMVLTGRVLLGALMSAFLLGFGPLCYYLCRLAVGTRFRTYWNTNAMFGGATRFLSPLAGMIELSAQEFSEPGAAPYVVLAVWAAAAILLGYWIYTKRPSEAAENAMVHPILEGIIKVAVVIPGALVSGLILQDIAGGEGGIWFIAGGLLGAFILNGIMEFIYTPDLKNIGRHWKSGTVALAGSAAILAFLVVYPMHYDTWIPAQEEVEAMGIFDAEQGYTFGIAYVQDNVLIRDVLKKNATENYAPIYELAEEGIAQIAQSGSGNSTTESVYYNIDVVEGNPVEGEYTDDYVPMRSVVILYRLKDGTERYRTYTVRETSAQRTIEQLSADPAQADWIYPVNSLQSKELREFDMDVREQTDGEWDYRTVDLGLSSSEMQTLVDLLKEETARCGLSVVGEEWIAEIYPIHKESAAASGLYYVNSIYIYPEYTETIAFLREKGVELKDNASENG